ncbi:phosphodiesterase [Christensenella intestinihominis]|uniref:phosphodiesterase n=1 Tax=Christensenella intestinihominis TaxID=1851429 RepID=UPI00083614E9|nr:phosphodiesterase [Christensenella intestinihominis]
MRVLIASDIHGSASFCARLMEAYGRERADRLLLLGDLLYHGPRNDLPDGYAPKKVISMLNGMKNSIMCVRGNCEAEVDQMVLEFPVMADYGVFSFGEPVIYATHGHVWNEENLPPLKQGDILLCGHTHIPKCTDHGSYVYMNPGSVSIPKEGSAHSYMIYENGVFTWKTLDGQAYMEYKTQRKGISQ